MIDISFSVGIVIDANGNLGLSISLGGNALLPAVGEGTGYVSVTNADNINLLKGTSMVLGGGIDADGSIGYEGVFFTDELTGEKFEGGTLAIGLGAAVPIPAEGHVGISYTWIPIQINLYDIFNLK